MGLVIQEILKYQPLILYNNLEYIKESTMGLIMFGFTILNYFLAPMMDKELPM